jgi:hypothetical protein
MKLDGKTPECNHSTACHAPDTIPSHHGRIELLLIKPLTSVEDIG